MHAHTWNVSIHLTESGPHTVAEAVLRTDAGTELRHEGRARRNPGDRDVPEIGDELATSRALMGLAQDLFEASVADIEQNTGTPVHLGR
jgi:hypothetical protein